MHAMLVALSVALSSQLTGTDRYGAPPDPAEVEAGVPDAGDAATRPDANTPQPSLADEPMERAGVGGHSFEVPSTSQRASDASRSQLPDARPIDRPQDWAPSGQREAAMRGEAQGPGGPSNVVAQLFRRPSESELSGVSLTLLEAVRSAATRAEQTRRTELYWDLAAATADYYLTLQEMSDLRQLSSSVANPGPEWRATIDRIGARSTAALHAARAAQQRMQLAMGRDGATSPPLAADLPHTGDYDARYQQLFAERSNATAQQLSRSLPLYYQNLRSEANRAAEAFQRLQYVGQQRNPQSDGLELLRAYETLALRRRVLVDLAREYNQAIAAYTALAVPSTVSSERVVAMLIRSGSDRSEVDGAVAPAGASAAPDTTAAVPQQGRRLLGGRQRFQARRPLRNRLSKGVREHSVLLNRGRRSQN